MKVDGALAEKENIRKIQKPLMEKKRRERINVQLEHLKALVCQGKDKLEKADILEHTVKHLKDQMQQPLPKPSDDEVFKAGYSRCAKEVTDYISSCVDLSPEARVRMLSHFGRAFVRASPSTGRPLAAPTGMAAAHMAVPTTIIVVPAPPPPQQQQQSPPAPAPIAVEARRLAPAPPPSAVAPAAAASLSAELKVWRPW